MTKEMPSYGDAWMRRGQARSALGEDEDALADLQRCIQLSASSSEPQRRADALHERGKIFQRQRDFCRAVAELQQSVELNPRNMQASPLLCLAVTCCPSILRSKSGNLRQSVIYFCMLRAVTPAYELRAFPYAKCFMLCA